MSTIPTPIVNEADGNESQPITVVLGKNNEEESVVDVDTMNKHIADLQAQVDKWKHFSRKNETVAKETVASSQTKEQELLTQLETLQTQVNTLQTKSKEADTLRVAVEKGLPLDSVKFLKGETPEEIAASADELIATFGVKNKQSLSPNPLQGAGEENKNVALSIEDAIFNDLNNL